MAMAMAMVEFALSKVIIKFFLVSFLELLVFFFQRQVGSMKERGVVMVVV